MMRWLLPLLVVLGVVACDAAPPRVNPRGQELRAELDQMTKDYSACIDKQLAAVEDLSEPAGNIAIEAVKACKPMRNALRDKVAAFDRSGHPTRAANQSEAVAEASVGVIEKDLREQAVVTIVKRQNMDR